MKRNKIKKKYLDQICLENKSLHSSSIGDKIPLVLTSIGLILLLICWGSIPALILMLFQVDFNNISIFMKVLISFASDILFLIILLSIYYKDIEKNFKDYFQVNFKEKFRESFSTWLIGFGIMIVSNLLIALITGGQISQNEESVRSMIESYPLYMAFQLVIYAPITEEIIFRKSIRNIFQNKKIYIFVSGFIFGTLHVLTSLNSPFGFLYLIPYCSLGFIFAYLYYKTDNIFSTVVAHCIHNTLALLIYLRGI